jgi:hypothetical protein
MKDEKKLKKIARDYLFARKKFRDVADKIPELFGNDNIIGRIGEFIALQFLEHKLKRKQIFRNAKMTEAGYDIIADDKKVSVKIITHENKYGRTTPIKDPWDELILIELGNDASVIIIGYLSKDRFKRAIKDKFLTNSHPIASRSMLNEKRLFENYGRIYTSKEIGKYL